MDANWRTLWQRDHRSGCSRWTIRSAPRQNRSWVCHAGLGAQVHDVAFAPGGELAVVSAIGPMVVQIMS